MANKASGDDDLEFREMLAKIGRRIDDDSLEDLKYQCRDIIGPGRLEKVSATQGLFEVLEERDELNMDDVTFLLKILQNVGRIDLYKVVKDYSLSRSRSSMLEPSEPCASSYIESDNAKKVDDTQKQDLASQSKKLSDVMIEDKDGQNCTVPFDTNEDNEQRAHCGGGYAITPEFQRGLDFVISQISRGWQIAARHLGVPDTVIEDAEYNWPRHIRSQVSETFRYWARNDAAASLQKLIEALRYVRRNDLADRLQSNRF